MFIPESSAYADTEFQRAKAIEFVPSVVARCASAENIILRKIRGFVLGNPVRDRQWNDIMQVIEVQGSHLDNDYLDRWGAHLGLSELLAEARRQAFR